MSYKKLTVSEIEYNVLSELKKEKETFTQLILRLAKKKSQENLLDYIRTLEPDPELANILEGVLQERIRIFTNFSP